MSDFKELAKEVNRLDEENARPRRAARDARNIMRKSSFYVPKKEDESLAWERKYSDLLEGGDG